MATQLNKEISENPVHKLNAQVASQQQLVEHLLKEIQRLHAKITDSQTANRFFADLLVKRSSEAAAVR